MKLRRKDAIGRCTRAAALAALVSAVGCTELSPDAKRLLLTAQERYERRQYREATERANRFLAAHADRPEAAEALYVRGLTRLRQKQREPARSDFRNALARSERDDLTARLQAQLGLFAADDKQWAAAVRHFEFAIDDLPDAAPTGEILYCYGRALQRIGRWPEARIQFAKILHFHRSSPAVKKARRQNSWKQHHFSIQCGAFSSRGRADRDANTLRSDGLSATARNDGALWRVYVGQYATYAEATRALPTV